MKYIGGRVGLIVRCEVHIETTWLQEDFCCVVVSTPALACWCKCTPCEKYVGLINHRIGKI